MHITRKTWVSAGIVSAILAGGISVTAAASAGRVDRTVGGSPEGSVEPAPAASRKAEPPATDAPPAWQQTPSPTEGFIISKDVNPDPGQVTSYWTEQRMREASPLPMPEVENPGEGQVNVIR